MTEKSRIKDTAKQIAKGQGDEAIVTLSTGIRVQLHPVSSSLVEEMRGAIKMPPVPKVWIEAKEREEENPNDPRYLEAVEEANRKKAEAVFDALIMFGIELIDGLPEDDRWLRKLRMLEKHGTLDLSGFDLKDEFDQEFLFKRYVAVAGADLNILGALHGFRPLEVARARAELFLGQETGDTDRGVPAEELGPDGDRDESDDV